MGEMLNLQLRRQTLARDARGRTVWQVVEQPEAWPADETALLLCDVWDRHWSRGANERLEPLLPRMDQVVRAARKLGVRILHAPSDTMTFYEGTPARQRVQAATPLTPPEPIAHEAPPLPVDGSDGGTDTGEPTWHKAWSRQHPAIHIDQDQDGISDQGQEVYSYLRGQGRSRLLILGVHTQYVCAQPQLCHQTDGAMGGAGGPAARPDRCHVQPGPSPLRQPRGGHPPGGGVPREVLVPHRAQRGRAAERRLNSGLLFAGLTALLWGSLPILLKNLLGVLDPYTLTWCRLTVTAGALALMQRGGKRWVDWRQVPVRTWWWLLAGMLSLTANYVFYLLALDHLAPSAAQVLTQLSPVFLLGGGMLVFGERFNVRQWAGFLFLLAGLALFFNNRYGELRSGDSDLAQGLPLAVGCAASWAVYALIQKQLQRDLPANFVLMVCFAGGSLGLLPLSHPGELVGFDGAGLLLLGLCILMTLASYLSFAATLGRLAASRFSVVMALTPLITVAGSLTWARFFPQLFAVESLNTLSLVGAGMVVSGSAMAALGARRG
ncbi:MAG: DMT family transporter [Candidatus Latescibacteria bacterium]|nr:DMT family transporter [Candidatus Latescibacterota bacterium]